MTPYCISFESNQMVSHFLRQDLIKEKTSLVCGELKNVQSCHSTMHDSKMLPCYQIKCPLLQNNKYWQGWELLLYGSGTFSIVSFVSGCAEEQSVLKFK